MPKGDSIYKGITDAQAVVAGAQEVIQKLNEEFKYLHVSTNGRIYVGDYCNGLDVAQAAKLRDELARLLS